MKVYRYSYIIKTIFFAAAFLLISCTTKNEAPEAPSIWGSQEGWVGAEETFFVSGTDLDADSISYLVNWGDGNFTLWSDFYASSDTISFTHAFAKESTYSISAIAKDVNEDTSNWSDDYQITIFKEIMVKWKYEAPPLVWFSNSPAIGEDGTVYAVLVGNLYAISPSGIEKWAQIFSNCFLSSPAIDENGTIYIGVSDMEGVNNQFIAFNPDGSIKWSYPVSSPTGGAIGSDGTVYFGSGDSCLYALNPDGNLKWFYECSSNVGSTPIIGQSGNIYFGTADGYYWAISSNGDFVWKLQLSTNPFGSNWRCGAIDNDETIYIPVDDGELYAIESDGTVTWHLVLAQSFEYLWSPIIGTDGTIYIGSESGFFAISSGGAILWQYSKECWGTAAITADLIMAPIADEIYALTTNGTIMARTDNLYIYFAPAISSEGTVYAVSAYGPSLCALEGQGSLANSAWPMYQHDARHTGRAE